MTQEDKQRRAEILRKGPDLPEIVEQLHNLEHRRLNK